MTFPKLTDNQVAVLQAEKSTGIVLNIHRERYLNTSEDEAYRIFETISLAREYIAAVQQLSTDIEFTIYDNKQSLVEFIH
ncbi:hypothetical protein [Chitinophaga eiseniae]|uniref:Uncharacterized protein n=1 Tax=Chitinophaga eiseniae TaxID=634771 RepID=A0A847SDP9_9BACT|nr:hypothetical protein [Chitinophaga eiseniae]NLR78304.1 hypothetical protein [Chitinophaga eiseniae]